MEPSPTTEKVPKLQKNELRGKFKNIMIENWSENTKHRLRKIIRINSNTCNQNIFVTE